MPNDDTPHAPVASPNVQPALATNRRADRQETAHTLASHAVAV